MADQRADDVVIEISIRTEDGQEAKSVDLSKDVFRTNDETGGVDFASDAAAQDVSTACAARSWLSPSTRSSSWVAPLTPRRPDALPRARVPNVLRPPLPPAPCSRRCRPIPPALPRARAAT